MENWLFGARLMGSIESFGARNPWSKRAFSAGALGAALLAQSAYAIAIQPAKTPFMLFEQNSFAVTESVRRGVEEVVQGWVGDDIRAGRPFCIGGHADLSEQGADWLSFQRAKVVQQELIKAGLPASQLLTSNFASGRMMRIVGPNEPPEQLNRYVIVDRRCGELLIRR